MSIRDVIGNLFLKKPPETPEASSTSESNPASFGKQPQGSVSAPDYTDTKNIHLSAADRLNALNLHGDSTTSAPINSGTEEAVSVSPNTTLISADEQKKQIEDQLAQELNSSKTDVIQVRAVPKKAPQQNVATHGSPAEMLMSHTSHTEQRDTLDADPIVKNTPTPPASESARPVDSGGSKPLSPAEILLRNAEPATKAEANPDTLETLDREVVAQDDEPLPIHIQTQTENPEPAPEESVEEFEDTIPAIAAMRTYKKDVETVLKDQKTTLVNMVLSEQRKKIRDKETKSPRSRKNLTLIVLSVIFFLGGIAVAFVAYNTLKEQTLSPETTVQTLIIVEEQIAIRTSDVPTSDVRNALKKASSAESRLDTVRHFYFTETFALQTSDGIVQERRVIGLPSLLALLDTKMPQTLLRAFDTDRYMFGTHTFNRNQPFIIFKTSFYENTFAGMLAWEKTMPAEFFTWFGVPFDKETLQTLAFRDEILKNKDVRVLRDGNGRPILYYSFKDRHTLVITTSENTLEELTKRLNLPVL